MSDSIINDDIVSGRSWGVLSIIFLLAMLSSHTLGVTQVSYPDSSYVQYSFAAAFWTLIYESGSTIVGPYSGFVFLLPNVVTLLWTALFFPLYLCIVYFQWRFLNGTTTMRMMLGVMATTLIIQSVILMVFFWYSVDGWESAAAYPLPIFHLLSYLLVLRYHEPERAV